MKIRIKLVACGLSVIALSACLGGEEGDGDEPIISSGILQLEVPDQTTYDALPAQSLRDMVDSATAANEMGTATSPTGSTSYHGTFGMSVGEGTVWGPAAINVDGAANVAYTFTATDVDDPDRPNAGVSGSFGGSATETGGIFSGGFTDNTLDFDADTTDMTAAAEVTLSGTVDGAFDDSNSVFGSITGSLTGAGLDEDVNGLFFAN